MSTKWQQLGAFIGAGVNLQDSQLDAFAAVGGRWAVPVTTNDGATGPWNEDHFEDLKKRCSDRGIRLGSWHNYFGEDPHEFAAKVAAFVQAHDAGPVFLDCEASVQGNALLSSVMLEVRQVLPNRNLAISTNSLNDSVVYNGRIEGVPDTMWRSAIDLGYRIAPQWYNAPRYGQRSNPWTTPDLNMAWLKQHGMEDNFLDKDAPGGRAVPLSYVHPTVEVTGIEGADLAGELHDLAAAKAFGFSYGLSIYLLEVTPPSDFDLLASARGHLFLA